MPSLCCTLATLANPQPPPVQPTATLLVSAERGGATESNVA